jgi:gamma-glutamyltranspeptidase / glutathione hydrolase
MQHDDQHIGFGIMGGMNQPLAHAQFVSNVVDYHMNIQAAMEAARFTISGKLGCNLEIESRVGLDAITQLGAMGHQLLVKQSNILKMGML